MLGPALLAAVTTVDADPVPERRGTTRLDVLQALDVAVAVVLYVVMAAALMTANDRLPGVAFPPTTIHLLVLACTAPVVLRRRRPVIAWQVALIAVVVASTTYSRLLTGQPVIAPAAAVAYVLCLYTLASRTALRVAVGALLWSLAGLLLVANVGRAPQPQDASTFGWAVAAVVLALVFGYNVRARRRAQRDLSAQARRSEQEQAARAVLEERTRIARELHDVVAHNMSVIAIQAEAAPLRTDGDVDALHAELAGIRTLALQTLTETRRILDVLRQTADEADRTPAPGLEQVDALVATVVATGMDVRSTVAGRPRAVPQGVGLSAYRIVQESLSNALRHAPGAAVTIQVTYRDVPPSLLLRIENDAPSTPPADDHAGPGHGLVGMRERVGMLEGELVATPTAAGGYLVEVSLPLEQ